MINLTKIQRSRLKITITFAAVLLGLSMFAMYMIYKYALLGDTNPVAAWSAWGTIVTAIATLAGYYVNKDTQRPSDVINTITNVDLNLDEDEDDPDEIPL